MTAHTAYIGLGANLGSPKEQVTTAIAQLADLPDTRLIRRSSLYRTVPVDADGDDYINAVVCLLTAFDPETLLAKLHAIEQHFGRKRPYSNAPRTLDLDLLVYDSIYLHMPHLVLPHPRITERAFVLVPLLEIEPNMMIPGKGAAKTWLKDVQHQVVTRLKD